MNYQEQFVVDFVRRTRKNLEYIEDRVNEKPDEELFEVTQLVNSLLGIIVLPREHYIKNIPETPLQELADAGWPIVDKLIGEIPQNCTNLRELITNLRHSIAHFNVEFIEDNYTHKLIGLTLWNYHRGKLRWRTTIALDELRKVTLLLFEIIETRTSEQYQNKK